MKIEILGTGCVKCAKAYELAQAAAEESSRDDVEIVKVEDINEITSRGVMMTPAVVIDGVLKSSGKLPSQKDFAGWLA